MNSIAHGGYGLLYMYFLILSQHFPPLPIVLENIMLQSVSEEGESQKKIFKNNEHKRLSAKTKAVTQGCHACAAYGAGGAGSCR